LSGLKYRFDASLKNKNFADITLDKAAPAKMDPVSITGLASSILGIMDMIGKTVDSLSGIRSRWKQANLTVTLMTSQLSTVKAALNEIGEWISSDPAAETAHHQLVIDLGQSVNSCNLLIAFINHYVSKFDWSENDESF
jgi:hypothetical protein